MTRNHHDRDNLSTWAGASTAPVSTEIATSDTGGEALRRFGPDPDYNQKYADCRFWENACEGMLEAEAKWKHRNQTFAWIDEKPVWSSVTDWEWRDILPRPDKPCVRTFRLTLLGGGQIAITQDFEWMKCLDSDSDFVVCYVPKLLVQAQIDDRLRYAHAVIDDGQWYEMSTRAVVFEAYVPQEIADRTAQTLRLINSRDDLLALLAHSNRCCCCDRPLTDEVSKILNIGPSCAKLMRLPHDIRTANRVLARRRELLGDRKIRISAIAGHADS